MSTSKHLSNDFLARLAELTEEEVRECEQLKARSSASIYAAFGRLVDHFLTHPHAFPKEDPST